MRIRETLQRLTDRGLRLTQQRRCIIAQIYTQEGHFDAEDLLSSLTLGEGETAEGSGLPEGCEGRASRATIYRMLPLLVEAGALRETMPSGKRKRYELIEATEHHEHFVCQQCGAVIEFYDAALEEAIEASARKRGFDMRRHSVEILGICPACAPRPLERDEGERP